MDRQIESLTSRSQQARSICVVALFGLLSFAALAQETGEQNEVFPAGEEIDTEEEALEFIQHPFAPLHPEAEKEQPRPSDQALATEVEDPCDWDLSEPHIQEDSQELLRGATCHTYRWFDSLFGDEIDYPEDAINGLVRVGFNYRKYDGFDPRLRLKVRAPLPNMSNRWDLILGRGDDDAFISDTQTQDSTFYNPGLVNTSNDDSWLLGLGHNKGGRKGWDWSFGVRLRTPPVPYVRGRWYYHKKFGDTAELRFRQSFFWRSDDEGFGVTSRADHAWSITSEDVIRWEAVATASEGTEGVNWYVGQTWYHLLDDNGGAFSLLAFVDGETEWESPIKDLGLNFIWRRKFTRDWMYLSLGPNITWPRQFEEDERELNLGFSVWVEMEFGEWRYR